jgi:5'-3' exonuclease
MTGALLVDGTALYVRSSRAAQRTGMNTDGIPTGTLTLFTHSLARLLRVHQPGHVLIGFDGPGSRDWRRKIWPGYKAGRPDPPSDDTGEHRQVLRLCDAAGLQAVFYAGYEADDVIAWGWRVLREAPGGPEDIVIASDDADLHQLLCREPRVRQVPLSAGGKVMDYGAVVSKYGCEPDQLPSLRALAGDPSDGIPGVRGTGPVRALRILREKDWELSAAAETMDPGQAGLVAAYRDIVDLVKPLQAIDYEPGMDRFPLMQAAEWSSGNKDGAANFFADMRMLRTLAKLEAGSLW